MMHPEPHDLTALAYGLVESPEREALLEHLAACDECRAAFEATREEQTAVREAVIRDARSGPAEARALERTLLMLEGAPESEPARGRVFSMWKAPLRVAAVLALAAGVLFVLKPEGEPDVVQVAVLDRAPAQVEEGVVLVPVSGAWRQAEAVPVDEWVKAGDGPLRLSLNGASAELGRESIFRISFEADDPVVNVLHGNVRVDTQGSRQFIVRAGEAGMYALPGSVLEVVCDGDEQWATDTRALRSWYLPQLVNAQVKQGDVVLTPANRTFHSLPLRVGETVHWTRDHMEARDADGTPLPLTLLYASKFHDSEDLAESMKSIKARIEELQQRHGRNTRQLDKVWLTWAELDQPPTYALRAITERKAATVIKGELTASLRAEDDLLNFIVRQGTVESSYQAESLQALESQLPADQQNLIKLFIVDTQRGKLIVRTNQQAVQSAGAVIQPVGAIRMAGTKAPVEPTDEE